MKKQLLLLILISLPLVASADKNGKCGNNLTWNFEEATGTLTISGEGEMYNYNYDDTPWYSLNENIQTLTINNGLTSIGNLAFYNLDKISTVTIPNSVIMIGERSFSGCDNLSVVTLSNNLKTIGNGAFSNCRIGELFIPSSVDNIGEYAFDSYYFTSIKVDKENPKYDSRNDCNCLIETASNTLIQGCSNSIIPEGVIKIAIGALRYYNFDELVIPSTVTSIESTAFMGCVIGNIFIPNSMIDIASSAFKNATISKVTISSIENWCSIDFKSGQANPLIRCHHLYLDEEEIINLIIPNNVSTIGRNAFNGGSNFSSITIGENVKTIGDYAFGGCENVTDAYCKALTPPTTGNNIFNGVDITKVTLYVPEETANDYISKEPWGNFGKILTLSGKEVDVDEISDVNSNLNCTVEWNGSSSSSITPWGSNYARGVDLTINNYSDKDIKIAKIDAYLNSSNIGSLPDVENTDIPAGTQKKFSFSISNTSAMPSTLPWLEIHYKIGAKTFVKDSRVPGTTSIHEINNEAEIIGIYDINGRKFNEPRKGLNIIRMNDGATKKVIVK